MYFFEQHSSDRATSSYKVWDTNCQLRTKETNVGNRQWEAVRRFGVVVASITAARAPLAASPQRLPHVSLYSPSRLLAPPPVSTFRVHSSRKQNSPSVVTHPPASHESHQPISQPDSRYIFKRSRQALLYILFWRHSGQLRGVLMGARMSL